jgi:hypothetical protein
MPGREAQRLLQSYEFEQNVRASCEPFQSLAAPAALGKPAKPDPGTVLMAATGVTFELPREPVTGGYSPSSPKFGADFLE